MRNNLVLMLAESVVVLFTLTALIPTVIEMVLPARHEYSDTINSIINKG